MTELEFDQESEPSDNDASDLEISKTSPIKRNMPSSFSTPKRQSKLPTLESPVRTPKSTVKIERIVSPLTHFSHFYSTQPKNHLGELGTKIILHLKRFATPFKNVTIAKPKTEEELGELLDSSEHLKVIKAVAAHMPIQPMTEKELELRKFFILTLLFPSMRAGQKFNNKKYGSEGLTILPDFMDEAYNIIGEIKCNNIFRFSSRYIKDWWNVMQLPLLMGGGLGILSDNDILLLFEISPRLGCEITPIQINTPKGYLQFVCHLIEYKNRSLHSQ